MSALGRQELLAQASVLSQKQEYLVNAFLKLRRITYRVFRTFAERGGFFQDS